MTWNKVFVQGPYDVAEIEMFVRAGYKRAKTIDEADIVVWTGGEDVNPALYAEKPLPKTFFSEERDIADVRAFDMSGDKFKAGICRGGQLLNVLSGGRLWQHVNNHGGRHQLKDIATGNHYDVSSTHHQQMRAGPGGIVVAECRRSTMKACEGQVWDATKSTNLASLKDRVVGQDIEVMWYPDTKSLCFQPHPEYGGFEACTKYFFHLIDRFYKKEA